MSIATQKILKSRGFRLCTSCGEIKPRTADYFDRHKTHGFVSECKPCRKVIKSKDYQENIEREREKRRNYANEHREDATLRQRIWRNNNPNRAKANRQRHYENNTDKYIFQSNQRKHKERANGGYFTEFEINALYDQQNGLCFYCWSDISGGYVKDHWIPVNKGGDNWIDNIKLCCAACNGSKSDKMPYEWKGR